jgi:hypothetical protein
MVAAAARGRQGCPRQRGRQGSSGSASTGGSAASARTAAAAATASTCGCAASARTAAAPASVSTGGCAACARTAAATSSACTGESAAVARSAAVAASASTGGCAPPVHGLRLRARAARCGCAGEGSGRAGEGSGRARRCGRTGERDGSASASGCTSGGDAGVWHVCVSLCALFVFLLLVLLITRISTKARAEAGERWAHPLGGLSCMNKLWDLTGAATVYTFLLQPRRFAYGTQKRPRRKHRWCCVGYSTLSVTWKRQRTGARRSSTRSLHRVLGSAGAWRAHGGAVCVCISLRSTRAGVCQGRVRAETRECQPYQ